MTKKKTTYRSKNYKWIRFLAGLGSALSLIFHILGVVLSITSGGGIESIVGGIIAHIVGAITCFICLVSLGLVKGSLSVKISWFSLLIIGIIDGVCYSIGGSAGLLTYGVLGTVMIVIAALIALLNRM